MGHFLSNSWSLALIFCTHAKKNVRLMISSQCRPWRHHCKAHVQKSSLHLLAAFLLIMGITCIKL